jgi:hypothetical protein
MSENENDFEMLRRLLALKRHETPPPGYFNRFSGEVIARIRAGETSESAGDWLSKLLQAFEFKPAFTGAFACALVLLLLVFGIVFAERPDSAPQLFLQPMAQNVGGTPQLAAVSPSPLPQSTEQTGIIAGTNPVLSLQPVAAFFGQQNAFAQEVSFPAPGN